MGHKGSHVAAHVINEDVGMMIHIFHSQFYVRLALQTVVTSGAFVAPSRMVRQAMIRNGLFDFKPLSWVD